MLCRSACLSARLCCGMYLHSPVLCAAVGRSVAFRVSRARCCLTSMARQGWCRLCSFQLGVLSAYERLLAVSSPSVSDASGPFPQLAPVREHKTLRDLWNLFFQPIKTPEPATTGTSPSPGSFWTSGCWSHGTRCQFLFGGAWLCREILLDYRKPVSEATSLWHGKEVSEKGVQTILSLS